MSICPPCPNRSNPPCPNPLVPTLSCANSPLCAVVVVAAVVVVVAVHACRTCVIYRDIDRYTKDGSTSSNKVAIRTRRLASLCGTRQASSIRKCKPVPCLCAALRPFSQRQAHSVAGSAWIYKIERTRSATEPLACWPKYEPPSRPLRNMPWPYSLDSLSHSSADHPLSNHFHAFCAVGLNESHCTWPDSRPL